MYTALYRQWRPRRLDEIKGQSHVTSTLKNALTQQRIGHAYLFCGPRGVGKTTVARILARAVNCKKGIGTEPCGECSCCTAILAGSSLDVLEIDAASNRGIDEIRDLRDKARFYPADCRYKVYIIDEVHMLTTEAFNALLKTLEEPPPHVIFILATTEPHRIPLTILSRCQRFDFHRLENKQIVEQMSEIIEKTGASAEPAALSLIARAADGSMRDALSVLDQTLIMGDGKAKEAAVLAILGVPDRLLVANTAKAISEADAAGVFHMVDELMKTGKDLRQFFKDLAGYFRDLLLLATGASALSDADDEELEQMKKDASGFDTRFLVHALKTISQTEAEMRVGGWPRLVAETTLLSLLSDASVRVMAEPDPLPKPVRRSKPKPAAAKPAKPHKSVPPKPVETELPAVQTPQKTAATESGAALSVEQVRGQWQSVLSMVRRESAIVAALLQEGVPAAVEADTLVVTFKHQFHRESLEAPDKKSLVERIIGSCFNREMQIRLEMQTFEKPEPEDPLQDPLVRDALELFGGEIINDKDCDI